LPVSFISCASEHVDNLGAYSIPSETGLLIPSVIDTHIKVAHNLAGILYGFFRGIL
jgi:hypothetical protein